MTPNEKAELRKLGRKLDTIPYNTKEWREAYDRYCELSAKEQEEYKAANIGNLKDFYDKHIAGKKFEEIDPNAWDFYSDYHKDVFGYRPRSLIFGE